MGYNNNNRDWKENNLIKNWRMRCYKVVANSDNVITILKCTKSGKKRTDGTYPDSMFIDVVVKNAHTDGVFPEKKNILVSGSFQLSDYNGKPQYTVFATDIKVVD